MPLPYKRAFNGVPPQLPPQLASRETCVCVWRHQSVQERQAALAAEAEASRRQMEEAAQKLREQEAVTNAELQRIANAGRRAETEAEARSARAESQAGSRASNLRTVSKALSGQPTSCWCAELGRSSLQWV
jgi:hypothetical protein